MVVVIGIILMLLYGALMYCLGVMRGRIDAVIDRLERY